MELSGLFVGRRVLVTGATGFIGSPFLPKLLSMGATVRAVWKDTKPSLKVPGVEWIQANLLGQEECDRVSQDMDYCIHAAGVSAGAGGLDPLDAVTKNLAMTSQMVNAAAHAGLQGMLVFSSSTGYPAKGTPVSEEQFLEADPDPVYWGYGWMRRYFERLAEFASGSYPTDIVVCRPTAVYGEGYHYKAVASHVIPALVHRALEKEDPFVVWGEPGVTRDFLHVEDFVQGCLLLLAHGSSSGPMNIGYGEGTTIKTLVETVLGVVGHQPKVVYDSEKPTTIPYRVADISKARKELGFSPSVPLKEGIQRYVAQLGGEREKNT